MKKLIYRFIFFLVLLASFQVIVSRSIVKAPRIAEIDLLKKFQRENYNFIIFGDSVIKSTDPTDTDQSSITKMLAKTNPSLKIGDLSHEAFHPAVYEALLTYILNTNYRPKTIIIPISLRSFSPGWDMLPQYQFEKEKLFLTTPHRTLLNSFYQPLAIFRAINLNTVNYSDFIRTPVFYGQTKVGVVNDYEGEKYNTVTPEKIRNKYVYNYMYQLTENHSKLKSLVKTIDLANNAGIRILAYITPIDFQGGENYVGPDFVKQTTDNVRLICKLIEEKNAPCINLAFSLDTNYFSFLAYPNEHLKEGGRKFIVQQISTIILP